MATTPCTRVHGATSCGATKSLPDSPPPKSARSSAARRRLRPASLRGPRLRTDLAQDRRPLAAVVTLDRGSTQSGVVAIPFTVDNLRTELLDDLLGTEGPSLAPSPTGM